MAVPDLAELESYGPSLAQMEAECEGPTPYEFSRDRVPVIRVCRRGHKVTVWTARRNRRNPDRWECLLCQCVARIRRERRCPQPVEK